MTEENKTPETTPGAEATPEAQPKQSSVGSDADRHSAKLRRKLEAQLAERDQRITDLEAKTKTDQEKAVDEAYKRGISEMEKRLHEERTAGALERELIKRGLDPDLAPSVRAKQEIDGPDAVAGAIDEWLTGKDWVERIKAGPRPAGQAGAPSVKAGPTTLTLKEVQKMSREEYTARYGEIQEGIASGRIQ